MKKQKGITLITLVVTIIILIILAGVVINLALGKNGLLNRSKQAKGEYLNAQEKEQQELNDLYSQILIATNNSSHVTLSVEDLRKIIAEEIKNAGATTNPTGTIISYMGNNAPVGYLFCDGTEYNISDYPNLAEQIKTEFGSYNYYGGDGKTKFAVPNLSDGRYLKGSTIAGINQEAGLPNIEGNTDSSLFGGSPQSTTGSNALRRIYTGGRNYSTNGTSTNGWFQIKFDASSSNSIYGNSDTVTPTNTSVLYCIKY